MTMKQVPLALLALASLCAAEKAPKAPEPKTDASVTVQISLGDLANARPSFAKLFSLDLPVKTAWTLRKTVSTIEAELKRYEEQRQSLFKKHGKPEKNGQWMVPVDNMQAFSDDAKALQEITVDLSITPVSISVLGENVKLSPADMSQLERFLIP